MQSRYYISYHVGPNEFDYDLDGDILDPNPEGEFFDNSPFDLSYDMLMGLLAGLENTNYTFLDIKDSTYTSIDIRTLYDSLYQYYLISDFTTGRDPDYESLDLDSIANQIISQYSITKPFLFLIYDSSRDHIIVYQIDNPDFINGFLLSTSWLRDNSSPNTYGLYTQQGRRLY